MITRGFGSKTILTRGLGSGIGIIALSLAEYGKRFTLPETSNLPIVENFTTGNTVTILLFDPNTGLSVPLNSNVCDEIGSTGFYTWDFSNLTTQPTELTHYRYTMTDGNIEKSNTVTADGWVDLVGVIKNFYDPVTSGNDIVLGDSWTPLIEIETDEIDLKLSIDITNQDGSLLNKSTSNMVGGSDDQISLVCLKGTSMTHRMFISASESALFNNDKVVVTVTYRLSNDTILSSLTYVFTVSATNAITWDIVN